LQTPLQPIDTLGSILLCLINPQPVASCCPRSNTCINTQQNRTDPCGPKGIFVSPTIVPTFLKQASMGTTKQPPKGVSSGKSVVQKKKASKFHPFGLVSEPDEKVALRSKHLNVSAGRVFYEKAASRNQRTRAALFRHSEVSRDLAVPLHRGGARGPGSTMLVARDDEEGNERDLRKQALWCPKPRKMGRSRSVTSSKNSYASLMPPGLRPPLLKRSKSEGTPSAGCSSRRRLVDKVWKTSRR
jgi:hypothetical protein